VGSPLSSNQKPGHITPPFFPIARDEERFLAFYLVTSARFCIFVAEKTDLRNQEDPYHDTL
jgi:hypothetical protein